MCKVNFIPIFLLPLIFITNIQGSIKHSGRKSINIELFSKWHETPFYLETSEFLAEENAEYFWNFIETINKEIGLDTLEASTGRSQYEISLALANSILDSSSKLDLLKFSLSLRIYSPTVAMFNQISHDVVPKMEKSLCLAFVEFSVPSKTNIDKFACSIDEVRKNLNELQNLKSKTVFNDPVLYKIDHIYPSPTSHSSPITAILYGSIGSSAFHELHYYLKELANKGQIKYAVRHYLKEISERKVSLSGYGVELAIKSTEYKAQDDTRVKGEENPNVELTPEIKPDETEGFVFPILKKQVPDKEEQLSEFQTHLLDSGKEIATLKVWEMQELSYQATAKILSVPKSEALKLLRNIAQNFPTVARSLIKQKVNNDLRREVEKNQHMFMQTLNLGPSDSAIFVNGLYYDIEAIDIFSLLHTIRQEIKVIEGLSRIFGNMKDRISKMIRLDFSNDKQEYQIDIRDSAVIYINDIETGNYYIHVCIINFKVYSRLFYSRQNVSKLAFKFARHVASNLSWNVA